MCGHSGQISLSGANRTTAIAETGAEGMVSFVQSGMLPLMPSRPLAAQFGSFFFRPCRSKILSIWHPNGDASLARIAFAIVRRRRPGLRIKLHQDQNLDLGGKMALQALYGLVLAAAMADRWRSIGGNVPIFFRWESALSAQLKRERNGTALELYASVLRAQARRAAGCQLHQSPGQAA